MPKGFTRVYVNQAMDNSTEVGPAGTLTRVLRERVDTSHVAHLASLADAECVLEARIEGAADALGTQVQITDPKVVAPPQVPKYTLALVGSARLIDKNAQIVWSSGNVRVEEDYLSGQLACRDANGNAVGCNASLTENAIPATESNRRRALERAAEQLANQLFTRMMEGF